MSMHFAPQWAKPIKPSGSSALSSATPAASETQQQPPKSAAAAPSSPFPALSQGHAPSPTTTNAPGKALSYSRVTHAPQSPSMSPDGYFPNSGDGANGGGNPSPYPFRYSREQILGIWDEKQFKERPIELMQVAGTDVGGVLVSKSVVTPVGLRELSENEKKLLSSSVHPPMPARRQMHGNAAHGNTADPAIGGRRGPQSDRPPKDTSTSMGAAPGRTGSGFGGGFGRGEGGALGGSKYSGSLGGEGRQPGAIGGGFGGVPKRAPRRDDESSRPSAAATWRPTRNPSTSGAFEGVLGFGGGGAPTTPTSTQPEAPTNGRLDSDRGWGAAEKQWRAAPTDERPLHIPTHEPSTQSVIATASATPVTERDAQLRESTPVPSSGTHTPKTRDTPQQDLGTINWYYRDPNGQEQGPFTGQQMHDWYSHKYFHDALPIRRENETTFHTLSELKTNTGNTVQPFLTAPRPRLPPNLPIPGLQAAPAGVPSPGALNESFGRLNMGGMPAPQPQYHPSAFQGSPFGQPQFNAAPQMVAGFSGATQQWHPAPGSQSPARLNGVYGSIGGTQQANYPPYGAPIGTPPIPRPEVFGAPIGQPSPWGAPAPVNQASTPTWQQQQHQQPTPQHMAQAAPIAPQQQIPAAEPTEPSYFPPVEETQPEVAPESEHADSEMDEDAVEDQLGGLDEPEREPTPEPAVPEPEPEVTPAAPKPTPPAPTSVWNKAPKASTKSAGAANEPTPAQASKLLPPPHASLPPKPTSAPVEPVKETTPPPASATPVEKAAPKPAPWAKGDNKSHGPSLREIQEAEARQAAARKAARAEARAAASPASIVPSSDDLPSSMSWGLPTSKGSGSTPTSATAAPAWGGASDGPKKTLKQIQEEEERRREKQARALASASAASGTASASKRGYADLAAHSASPTPAQAAAAAAAGWTTVGAGGKASGVPAKPPASIPAKPVAAAAAAAAKPATPKPVAAKSPAPPVAEDQPSIEFIRWTKQALTGLTVPVDEFISMLLMFPADPPAASRAEQQEIIADSVYASSSTLDGRRFAAEFMTRRKADAKRDTTKAPAAKIGSLADVVKTQPKPPAADVGFKVVKPKKKRT